MGERFGCGHPHEGNTVGIREKRCGICARARLARHRERIADQRPEVHNTTDYTIYRDAEPIDVDDRDAEGIALGTRTLLRALFREHPYVFEAAARTGRMAVRP